MALMSKDKDLTEKEKPDQKAAKEEKEVVTPKPGMADYIDALYDHHFTNKGTPAERNQSVHDLMRGQEILLLQPLLEYLAEKNSIRLLGPRQANKKAPTVAMVTADDPDAIAGKLADYNVMASGGDFYANRCIEGQGESAEKGVLRVSFVHYTEKAEIDQLIDALDRVL